MTGDGLQKSLTTRVEQALENVRSDRPLTGIAAAGWTLMAMGFTAIAGLALAAVFGLLGALITRGAWGGGVGAIIGVGLSLRIPARPNRDWRARLAQEGMAVKRRRAATEVELLYRAPVRVFYRLAPGDQAVESLVLRCTPALPATLKIETRELRLGAPTFDGGLQLEGAPIEQACVTAALRSALARLGRPVVIRQGMAQIAIRPGRFELPDGAVDDLAAALHQLTVDLADPIPALQRIAGEAPFDAARAAGILLADGVHPANAPDDLVAFVRAGLAGQFEVALALPITADDKNAMCRGLYRAGVCAKVGFASLVFATKDMPDTEAGCIEALGVLTAIESLAAAARFERLGAIGSLAAARWLGAAHFPHGSGIQAAADAARAVIHRRLHVHGALSIEVADVAGGMTIVEAGQLSASDDSAT